MKRFLDYMRSMPGIVAAGLLYLIFSIESFAADPFDRTQRKSSDEAMPNAKIQTTKCVFNEPILAAESTFEQLKLVGVVLYKQQPEALFLDSRQQLVIAKQGARLGLDGYLLKQIRKSGVTVQRAKAGQCEQTEAFDLRF